AGGREGGGRREAPGGRGRVWRGGESAKSGKWGRGRVVGGGGGLGGAGGVRPREPRLGKARQWFEQVARLRGEQQAPLQSVEQTVLPHSCGSPQRFVFGRHGQGNRRRSPRGWGPCACRAGHRSGS